MSTHHSGRCALRVLCRFAFAWFAPWAAAQTLPQEYATLIRSDQGAGPLDANLLGDRIDYYTGHVEFVATDVSLPGNNALPVAIGRRYVVETNPAGVVPERDFGDWDIEVPHIEGIVAASVGWTVPGANPNARCSAFAGGPDAIVTTPSPNDPATAITTTVPWEQYSIGYQIAVPGYGRRELLKRAQNNTAHPASGSWPIVTNDWWMIGCLPSLAGGSPGSTGEGFVALAPDGTKYTFDWLALRPYVALSRPADTDTPNVTATLDRNAAWMMATKVEDRFGNWVKYAYDPSAPLHLHQITSSDGRTLTLTYLGSTNSVQSISDGTRMWSYGYTFNGAYYSLSSVTQPDASKWQIAFDTLNHVSWSYANPWTCGAPGSPSAPFTFAGTITHPSGAQGKFTFTITRRGRNGAPATCYTNSANVAFASVQPGVYDTLALTQKQISGPGLASPLTWSLAYAGCSGSACASTVTTTITDPRGYGTRYTFGTGYDDDEGLLLKKDSGGSGATYLETETYQYSPATGQSYPAPLGTATQSRGDTVRLATLRPLQKRTTTLQGTTFTYAASSLDAFGFPQSIVRAGSATKAETVTYANNTAKWVLGTVQKIVSSGSTERELVLDALSMPTSISRFGQVDRTFGYNTDGTLQWTKDGNGHATNYSNWYRGIPKNTGYATGESESVTVSNTGTIDSHTDERGSATTYDHDTMGRVSGIHYPAGDPGTGGNQTFAPTTIAWSTSAAGWQSTETTDTSQTITKYDALLRPILVNENNALYVNTKYDGDGGPAFVSVPSTLPNEGSGTSFTYDGLGRVTQESFVGYATSYAYQAGFVTRMSDPNATTYVHYLTHDEPSTAWPVTIDGPIYTTDIARDAWGRSQTISRGALKREWTWGGRFVCAIYSPERGTTVFARDGAGNVTGSADLAGDVGCDYGAINGSNKIARGYDNRNRLTSVAYPGGTDENIAQTWWPNGLVKTASRGGITRTTNYNRRGLLTYETLAIDGDPYEIDYAYNTRGQLSGLTYPDGTAIDYASDAWGEPTKVGTYASGITYWPNGAVKTFSYGNGIAHAMSQNTRQLPQTVVDGSVINTDYGYDGVGNVTAITDHLAAHTDSVAMGYDLANRLQTANAAAMWGNATFGYDDSDNLKSATVGGVATSFTIDAATNRATAMVIGGVSTSLQYDGQGHLTHKGAQTFTFDRSDLLLGLPGIESYRYDADGGRTVTEINGGERLSIYDHKGRLLEELEPAPQTGCAPANDRVFCSSFEKPPINAAETRYAYLGTHLIGKDDSQGRHYLHTDALGSLLAETDQSQVVTHRYHYQPFGGAYGTQPDGPGYTGAVTDANGLVYLQARYYDPQLGRFLSTDTVDPDPQSGANFNRYAYAENNPYSKYDPNGRCAISDVPNADGSSSDDGQPCPGQAQSSVISDALGTIDSTMAATGPIGAELSGAERAGTAAAEEIGDVASQAIKGVDATLSSSGGVNLFR
ncbi:MAG TPA: RHS repeat-associated core domain-containing protein, partial [Rhodanobacteraceae bacterium]|nr:RHS repeat-associated core domain-containing protein [Rhodanobacteraceae bacterium]